MSFMPNLYEKHPLLQGLNKTDEADTKLTPTPAPASEFDVTAWQKEQKRKLGLAQVATGRGTNSYPLSGPGSALIG